MLGSNSTCLAACCSLSPFFPKLDPKYWWSEACNVLSEVRSVLRPWCIYRRLTRRVFYTHACLIIKWSWVVVVENSAFLNLVKVRGAITEYPATSFTYVNVLWRTRYRTIVAILTCKWSGRVFCNLAKLFEGQRGYEPRSSRCTWICYFSCTVNTPGIFRALLFYVIITSASATIASLPAKLNSAQLWARFPYNPIHSLCIQLFV